MKRKFTKMLSVSLSELSILPARNRNFKTRYIVAKPELGTKRTCPETERNFYDLNKDPIVSPYTGKEYNLSFFEAEMEQKKPKTEAAKPAKAPEPEENAESEEEEAEDGGPEVISLEEADDEAGGSDDDDEDGEEGDEIASIPDVEVEDDEEDTKNNTFLEDDDDEDTDLSDVIGTQDGDEKDDTWAIIKSP